MSEGQPTPTSTPVPASAPPQTIVIQPRESWFGRFGKVLLVLLGLAVMMIFGLTASYQSYINEPGGPQEKFHSLNVQALKKIAVIEAEGVISEADPFIKQQIDKVRKDDSVVAVVLRINSPGGTVTYSDYLLHHLNKLVEYKEKKTGEDFPLVVSMGSVAASGGYYIAMAVGDQEDAIFAEKSTITGSIGVIVPHYDFSETIKMINARDDSIASGKFKQMGSPTRQMSEEERELFAGLVDEMFTGFKEVIYAGRPAFRMDKDQLDKLATGQVFTGTQAVKNGLVDKLGFIEDAIDRAAELANISTEDVRCVRYEKTPSAIDALLGASAAERLAPPRSEAEILLDLTSPRAYYLYSLLPSLLDR